MKENNNDLRALGRLLAFAIAKCDSGAEELLEWAYSKELPEQETKSIIDKFLATDGKVSANIKKEFVSRFITGSETFPVQAAKAIILHMPYEDFLKTPYWKAISGYIKERDLNRCEKCGAQKRLQVHHLSYQHHGDELHNMNELVTLCRKCHKETHEHNRTHKTP